MKVHFKSHLATLVLMVAAVSFISCSTTEKKDETETALRDFIQVNAEMPELFRVFITSDRYVVAQTRLNDRIERTEDAPGDRYICEELKRYDKIDMVKDGIITVWLFPDSGRLMRVRPQKLTYLMEIDKLIVDDVQRWSFQFPKKYIEPSQFDIHYRIVLRKTMSDDEIMKEVRERIKEKTGSN
jgi:hypothetical protein